MISHKANGHHLVECYYEGTSAHEAMMLLAKRFNNSSGLASLCKSWRHEVIPSISLFSASAVREVMERHALLDVVFFHSLVELAFKSGFISTLDDLARGDWREPLKFIPYVQFTQAFLGNPLPSQLHHRLSGELDKERESEPEKFLSAFIKALDIAGGAICDPSVEMVRQFSGGNRTDEVQVLLKNLENAEQAISILGNCEYGWTPDAEAILAVIESLDWARSISEMNRQTFSAAGAKSGFDARHLGHCLFGAIGGVGRLLERVIRVLRVGAIKHLSTEELVVYEASLRPFEEAIYSVAGNAAFGESSNFELIVDEKGRIVMKPKVQLFDLSDPQKNLRKELEAGEDYLGA